MINRIFLTGFRATGKTTLGKAWAQRINWSFLDMDFLIAQEAAVELNVLTKNGSDWTKFRELENEILKEVSGMKNVIISCGGGVGVNDIIEEKSGKTFGELNREVIKNSEDSLVVLLTSDDEVIRERLERQFKNKKIMPFLNLKNLENSNNPDLVAKQVNDSMEALQKRKSWYPLIADIEIDSSFPYTSNKIPKINIILGDPVKHSLSPKMHTAGYKALDIESDFLFISCKVDKDHLEKFTEAVKVLGINGISVTIPHKEFVMQYLDEVEETAKKIGAVNTIINNEGKLKGFNTDWTGAVIALEKKTNIKDKKIAVIGAGGASRAIIYGLVKKGAEVKIINRTREKAEKIAQEFRVEVGNLEDIEKCDIIINTTSVGMNEEKSPVSKDLINKNQIVFDIVYSPKETKLIKDAKEKGAQVIYGYEMLLYQGVEQFKIYTRLDAPVKEMEKALLKNL